MLVNLLFFSEFLVSVSMVRTEAIHRLISRRSLLQLCYAVVTPHGSDIIRATLNDTHMVAVSTFVLYGFEAFDGA